MFLRLVEFQRTLLLLVIIILDSRNSITSAMSFNNLSGKKSTTSNTYIPLSALDLESVYITESILMQYI